METHTFVIPQVDDRNNFIPGVSRRLTRVIRILKVKLSCRALHLFKTLQLVEVPTTLSLIKSC